MYSSLFHNRSQCFRATINYSVTIRQFLKVLEQNFAFTLHFEKSIIIIDADPSYIPIITFWIDLI
jgi:hypothetical protein